MVRSLKSPTFWVAFAALVVAMSVDRGRGVDHQRQEHQEGVDPR